MEPRPAATIQVTVWLEEPETLAANCWVPEGPRAAGAGGVTETEMEAPAPGISMAMSLPPARMYSLVGLVGDWAYREAAPRRTARRPMKAASRFGDGARREGSFWRKIFAGLFPDTLHLWLSKNTIAPPMIERLATGRSLTD